eukprot:scaffold33426_cov94-Skeletonema_dohrnii-CCMP3373.AAC.1
MGVIVSGSCVPTRMYYTGPKCESVLMISAVTYASLITTLIIVKCLYQSFLVFCEPLSKAAFAGGSYCFK